MSKLQKTLIVCVFARVRAYTRVCVSNCTAFRAKVAMVILTAKRLLGETVNLREIKLWRTYQRT